MSTAQSLADGHGFRVAAFVPPGPFAHWAPIYPLILSLPTRLHIDPRESSKWINILSFELSVLLVGVIVLEFSGSQVLGLMAAAFMVFSVDMVRIHSQVLTEPIFIAIVLGALLMLSRYMRTYSNKVLIASAALVSVAMVTRYAGGFLLPVIAVAIIQAWRSKKLSPPHLIESVAIMLAPISLWLLRNSHTDRMLIGYRALVIHPAGIGTMRQLLHTVSLWILPSDFPGAIRGAVVMLAIALVTIVVARRSEERPRPRLLSLVRMCCLFVGTYVFYFVLTISLLDAQTSMNLRLLSPMYPVAVIVVLSALFLMTAGMAKSRYALSGLFGLLLAISAARTILSAKQIRTYGVGFQMVNSREKALFDYVKKLQKNTVLYSDDPYKLYFGTNRPSHEMPRQVDLITTLRNSGFESELAEMMGRLNATGGFVIVFDSDRLAQIAPLAKLGNAEVVAGAGMKIVEVHRRR